ncbi:MAG: GlsB/YeaQ/YmgE family stress response membrane protein [Gemmatimonadota bacterium]|nr:GlsB/YeaQ/YmgE family stress response membrane protein [Gemmatimonadota bacterium]HEU4988285.1 GlsB/YeaQ/YmgE family stress response membrane protein [Gemmatimonadaceae bacterium]
MSWIISLIIGGIVGWLASIVMKTNAQMGWIANVLVGVVGAALGNWIAGLIGLAPTGGVGRFVVALLGAVVLIFILRALGFFKKKAA